MRYSLCLNLWPKLADRIKNHPSSIALWGILLLSFTINSIGIGWGLPDLNGWAADEVIPLRVLEGVDQGFANGWYYKYPPVHFYLLTLVYAPLLLLHHLNWIDVYQLPTYTQLFYLGRLLTLFMSVGLLYSIYRCGREIGDRPSALITTLIASLSINYIYYSKTINLEIPYLFWLMLSMWYYIRILKFHQLRDYLLFSLMAAVTVATKDQAYAFYFLTPGLILWQHYRYRQQQNPEISWRESLGDRKIKLSLAVGLGAFLLFHNVIFNLEGFFKHIDLIIGGNAKIDPIYESSIFGHLKMLGQSLTHLRFAMGWPFFALCWLGFFKYLPKLKQNWLLYSLTIPFLSYYLFYIALLRDNHVRYLMPIGIMLAFFGGKLLADWLNPSQKRFRMQAIAIILAIVATIYTLAYGLTVNMLMLQDSRYAAEAWMAENMPLTAVVWGGGDRKYLPRLDSWNAEIFKYPTLELFSTKQPDYIVLTSGHDIRRFATDSPEYQFFDRVINGSIGYDLIWEYESVPRWYLWNRQEVEYRNIRHRYIYSNFDKINPRIKIFQRRD